MWYSHSWPTAVLQCYTSENACKPLRLILSLQYTLVKSDWHTTSLIFLKYLYHKYWLFTFYDYAFSISMMLFLSWVILCFPKVDQCIIFHLWFHIFITNSIFKPHLLFKSLLRLFRFFFFHSEIPVCISEGLQNGLIDLCAWCIVIVLGSPWDSLGLSLVLDFLFLIFHGLLFLGLHPYISRSYPLVTP